MKVLSKTESKEFAHKISRNIFFEFSHHGYQLPEPTYTMFTPSHLIISCIQALEIDHKFLRATLMKTFRTTEVSQMQMEFTYQLMGFEFEGHKFLVWFNATGKGSTVETKCTDPGIHHRFCRNILKALKYKLRKSDLEFMPQSLKTHLNPNRSLKEDYLDKYLVSREQFIKNTPHLKY